MQYRITLIEGEPNPAEHNMQSRHQDETFPKLVKSETTKK